MRQVLRSLCAVWAVLSLSACNVEDAETTTSRVQKDGSDIQAALSALRDAQVVGAEGGIPYFIRGQLGRVGPGLDAQRMRGDPKLHESLRGIAPVFRLRGEDLVLTRVRQDEQGHRHLRFQQLENGLRVVGGGLILHADAEGLIYAANSSVQDGAKAAVAPTVSEEAAVAAAVRGAGATGAVATGPAQLVYLLGEGTRQKALAYEVRVKGDRGELPADDLVYVDAERGAVLAVHPQVHSALNRRIYDGLNLSTLPGTLVTPPVADPVVNINYSILGTVYHCYSELFGRDSFNNGGATLISTVHHRVNYVNAFWNGTQMVYGDGDGVTASNLATSLDVTAHELTHAVTDYESDLIYSGESGGLDESMSDIFAAVCEWYGDGRVVSDSIWLIGDDIWTPNIPNDALRYMANPTQDGDSLDWYPDYEPSVDPHYSSGIANLAFYLLSQGGTHPRGKSPQVVTGIGIEKAARIWYRANVDLLLPSTTMEQAKVVMEQAAMQLGYDAATVTQVSNAWKAVGVGVVNPPAPILLSDGVPVTGLQGPMGHVVYFAFDVPPWSPGGCGQGSQGTLTISISGGTGDADLYVKYGSPPTLGSYDCRPYLTGNNETCVFTAPAPGRWYVMLHGYTAFDGVTLKATLAYPPPEPTRLTLSGSVAPGEEDHYGPYCVVAGTKLKAVMTGTGNPDLYVRWNASPTLSQYHCRPLLGDATETCELTVPPGTTAAYLMVRGNTAGTYNVTWYYNLP